MGTITAVPAPMTVAAQRERSILPYRVSGVFRQSKARQEAMRCEGEAARYPDERAEILLEAAAQWCRGGDPQRALDICDELMATAPVEDAGYAAAQRLDALLLLGRGDEVDSELARLSHQPMPPGPASLVAEFCESQDRLSDALTWFDIACGDVGGDQIDQSTLLARPELRGRTRVRQALGLAPDALDRASATAHAELIRTIEDFADSTHHNPQSAPRTSGPISLFFTRADLDQALAQGLVQVEPDTPAGFDADSYYKAVEKTMRDADTRVELVCTRVEDLLGYAAEHDLDPRDQQTRLDYTSQQLRDDTATIAWPPPRNAPCWCDSGRKYKKCCGTRG
jgi:hypothetical protein